MSINKLNFQEKQTGDILEASEWNQTVSKIDELVDASNNGGGSGNNGGGSGAVTTEIDQEDDTKTHVKINNVESLELTSKGNKGTNVSLVSDNNINIEPRQALGTGDGKNDPTNANRKGGNIAFKPGDDIEFWGHHRGSSKNDEVSVKIMTEVPKASDPTKTDEVAAKLQLNAADIVLTSKDKQTESDEMNIVVNKAANTRGYLKVRAQAIDLRCENHGGIALQPKGDDGEGHENKIKFEHNGGDGKEFGTFNTQKTSIFTDQYRFNKSGLVYPVTRGALETTYKVDGDPTSGVKKIDYPTQADDFKDILDNNKYCTWEDIVAAGQGCSVNDKGLTIKNNKNTTNVGPIAEANFGNVLLYTQFYAKPLAKGTNTDELDDSISAIQNPENVPNAKQIAAVATALQLPSDTDIEADAAAILANFPVNTSEIYTAKEIIEKFYTYANVQYIQEQLKLAYEQGKYIKFSSRGASVIFQPIYKELELSSGFINYPVNYAQTKQDGDIRVKVSDIAKLVTWMKTNNQGPWAAQ